MKWIVTLTLKPDDVNVSSNPAVLPDGQLLTVAFIVLAQLK